MGKVIAFSILTLLAFSLIAGFVVATDPIIEGVSGGVTSLKENSLRGFLDEWFLTWLGGKGSESVAKVLFAIIILIIVYTVADKLPFLKETGRIIKFIFSFIVTALATLYLLPQDVALMLMSFTSMGLALGALIPFIILAYFTYSLAQDDSVGAGGRLGNQILCWILWGFFVASMIYRIVSENLYPGANPPSYGAWLFAYAMLAAGIVMMASLFWIFRLIRRTKISEMRRTARERMNQATANQLMNAKQHRDIANAELPPENMY